MCLNLDTGNTACRTLPRTDTYIIIHIKRGTGNYFSDKREFVDGCIAGGQLIFPQIIDAAGVRSCGIFYASMSVSGSACGSGALSITSPLEEVRCKMMPSLTAAFQCAKCSLP